MKAGDIVSYLEKLYEVSEVRTDSKGMWVKFSSSPKSSQAIACTGITAECWFLSNSLEVIDESR